LQDCPTPSRPIGDELPPRRTPTTPLASHRKPCTSPSLFLSPTPTVRTPLETKASATSQPLLPHHQCPLATVDATQSLPAAPTSRRSCSRPDHVMHAPWTRESVHRVPARAHVHSPRAAHRSARHRAYIHATHTPSSPMPQRGLLVNKTLRTRSETNLALATAARD
jgi:hypothetical protein